MFKTSIYFTISDKELAGEYLNYDSNEQITKVYEFNKYLGNIGW